MPPLVVEILVGLFVTVVGGLILAWILGLPDRLRRWAKTLRPSRRHPRLPPTGVTFEVQEAPHPTSPPPKPSNYMRDILEDLLWVWRYDDHEQITDLSPRCLRDKQTDLQYRVVVGKRG